jgi:hypothetical protein
MKLGTAVLESKKAQALTIGVFVAVFGSVFGLSEDQIGDATNVVIAYIAGQGVADAGLAIASKPAPPG